MRRTRRFRRILESWLVYPAIVILPLLPRKVIIWLANKCGNLLYHIARKQRKQAEANIRLVFNTLREDEIHRLIRSSFRNVCLTVLDTFWFSFATEKRLRKWVIPDDSFKKYMAISPAIFVSGHFGNWEILGLAGAFFGGGYTAVAASLRNPAVNKIARRIRHSKGQNTLPVEGAVDTLRKVLENKGRIGMLVDQNTLPDEGGLFVKFFGLKVPVTRTMAVLSARFDAPVIVTQCTITSKGCYILKAMPPLKIHHGPDYLVKGTEEVMKRLEMLICSAPDQWLWAYKRWKYVPEGENIEKYPFYAEYYSG